MKVLKALLVVLTLSLGSALMERNFPRATEFQGGPLTFHSILAVNPAIIAVVGDYQYFLKCTKYKVELEKVRKEKEDVKINYLYPSCTTVIPAKVC